MKAIFGLLLILTACDQGSSYSSTEDMVDDLSGAAVDEAVSPVRSSVEEHEQQIADLESKITSLESDIAALRSQDSELDLKIADLDARMTQ